MRYVTQVCPSKAAHLFGMLVAGYRPALLVAGVPVRDLQAVTIRRGGTLILETRPR